MGLPEKLTDDQISEAVGANKLWYHSIELRSGIETPGWFDLRPILSRLPFPDVRGKRCLDIGTFDGFFAFELEKRGASEVVATDIGSNEEWDWAPAEKAKGLDWLKEFAGEKGYGFEVVKRALGSKVEKKIVNVYDLSPALVGTFDVVVCGSLLLHLRDPMRALEAIRSVCSGSFMSCEQIDLTLTLLHRRKAVTRFGPVDQTQWFVPNLAAHRSMIAASGFKIARTVRPYSVPYGTAHRERSRMLFSRIRERINRYVTGNDGVPHSALLAEPAEVTGA